MQNYRATAENAAVSRLMYSHLADQPLSEVDKLRRMDWFSNLFVDFQWLHGHHLAGLLGEFDSLEHVALACRSVIERTNDADVWRE